MKTIENKKKTTNKKETHSKLTQQVIDDMEKMGFGPLIITETEFCTHIVEDFLSKK